MTDYNLSVDLQNLRSMHSGVGLPSSTAGQVESKMMHSTISQNMPHCIKLYRMSTEHCTSTYRHYSLDRSGNIYTADFLGNVHVCVTRLWLRHTGSCTVLKCAHWNKKSC